MADNTVVHIGENSPEKVAFDLMELVGRVEKKSHFTDGLKPGFTTMDRKWLLDTFAECLTTVKGYRSYET
jgi:hypothetical protein